MARFIVLDIVFKASSLNYDLGGPTYHELKKIRRWNGKVHTLVSRYALRYSILETGEKMGLWKLAPADKLQRAQAKESGGRKGPIQPNYSELLTTGKILEYPEFDLFGYMITDPVTNIRETPVKISHAISMTPYTFDKHFSANIGLARRMMRKEGKMEPSPIHIEEHEAYYIYNVIIDVDRIGKVEIYVKEKNPQEVKKELEENGYIILKEPEKVGEIIRCVYGLRDVNKIYKRILNLVKVLLKLKRNIKGRSEDLSPVLLVIGFYENTMYDTYKDRIKLISFEREYIEEIEERQEQGKLIRIVRRKSTLSDKPEFVVHGLGVKPQILDENKILQLVEYFLEGKKEELLKELNRSSEGKQEDSEGASEKKPAKEHEEFKFVAIFHRPGVRVSLFQKK